MSNLEQTLSIIKPDAVERNLSEEIKEKTIDLTIMITKNIINNKFKINYKDKILQRSLLELSDSIKN